MNLHIIRHAPVISHKGFIYGDDALIDLEKSKQDIIELSEELSHIIDRSHWYHSGVDRALKTAQAVLSFKEQHHELTENQYFREQNFGDLIGKSHEDAADQIKFYDGKILAHKPPHGETLEQFILRVSFGIQEVRNRAKLEHVDNIVIFSHGGTIRAVDLIAFCKPIEDFIKLDTPSLKVFKYYFLN